MLRVEYTTISSSISVLQRESYLPIGWKLWVCAQCVALLAFREWINSLEATVANLGTLRETEKYVDEILRDLLEPSQSVHLHECAHA